MEICIWGGAFFRSTDELGGETFGSVALLTARAIYCHRRRHSTLSRQWVGPRPVKADRVEQGLAALAQRAAAVRDALHAAPVDEVAGVVAWWWWR